MKEGWSYPNTVKIPWLKHAFIIETSLMLISWLYWIVFLFPLSFRLYQQIRKTKENHTTLEANIVTQQDKPWDIKLEFYLEHRYTDKYKAKTSELIQMKTSWCKRSVEQQNKNETNSVFLITNILSYYYKYQPAQDWLTKNIIVTHFKY